MDDPVISDLLHLAAHCHQSGDLKQAEELCRRVLQAEPAHCAALTNLGLVLKKQGKPREATDSFRLALRIEPRHSAAAYNLGNLLMEEGVLAEAACWFREALKSDPRHVGAHNNLGCVLMDEGQRAEAAACFAEALRLQPGHARTLWNRARLHLVQGDLPEAWADHEFRLHDPGFVQPHQRQPRWDGSPLGGKTILLWPEQGLGDTIQFIRYAALVKERGGRVLFECPAALSRLLVGVAGIDHFVSSGTAPPPFDVQTPLLSLPYIFGTTLANVPAVFPYLHADPGLGAHWKRELASLDGLKSSGEWRVASGEKMHSLATRHAHSPLIVGIAWQGNSQHAGDRYRSFPLRHFEPLAKLKGVRLVSLQKGQGTEQLAAQFPVLDLADRLDAKGPFLDTAAIMMSLDLVVTVDSAVAHLAGALGVPVWVPLCVAPDWRWLLEREDSPWYPTMRLFRQEQFGDWTGVFERMASALATR